MKSIGEVFLAVVFVLLLVVLAGVLAKTVGSQEISASATITKGQAVDQLTEVITNTKPRTLAEFLVGNADAKSKDPFRVTCYALVDKLLKFGRDSNKAARFQALPDEYKAIIIDASPDILKDLDTGIVVPPFSATEEIVITAVSATAE